MPVSTLIFLMPVGDLEIGFSFNNTERKYDYLAYILCDVPHWLGRRTKHPL